LYGGDVSEYGILVSVKSVEVLPRAWGKNMNDTIAAVIPLYNKEPYITRAIVSVIAQTQPVHEIIVVDDASTDGSLERLKDFLDSRIRILHTNAQQRGVSAARNFGIVSATSRWIALLDADDRWHENFIEEIQRLIARATDDIGFLFTGWDTIWPDGRVTRDPYSRHCNGEIFTRLDLESFVAAWVRIGACPALPSGVVIRRDILLDVGLFHERCRRGEDKEMWIRVLAITDALSSSRCCSSYYAGVPGAANENVTTNVRHCLFDTLDDMIARSSAHRRRLLMRLFNQTALEYARWAAGRVREPLSPEVYGGFFVSVSPQAYLLLLAFRHVPVPLLRLARQVMLGVRKSWLDCRTGPPSHAVDPDAAGVL
jgi:succinoglycan biosynthesis protein ExoO